MNANEPAQTVANRCAAIRLLVLDVDGVLSDGNIYVNDQGEETKQFYVRDGAGIAYWRRRGGRIAILSGRACRAVDHRAAELGIERVVQGRLDKGPALRELLDLEQLGPHQACMVGDDLADLDALRVAGVSAAPSDAAPEVQAIVDYVSPKPGGRGAVRDVIEWLLRAQGHWDDIVASPAGPART